jgi:hypothetical protein
VVLSAIQKREANHFPEKGKIIDLSISPKEDKSGFAILMYILETWLIDNLTLLKEKI